MNTRKLCGFLTVFSFFVLLSCASSSRDEDISVADSTVGEEDISIPDSSTGELSLEEEGPKATEAAESEPVVEESDEVLPEPGSESASSEPTPAPAPEPAPAPVVAETSTEMAIRPEDTLAFSRSAPDRGVGMNGIDWQSELNQNNPGIDCDLKKRKSTARMNTYSCVSEHSNGKIIVTASENVKSGVRKLRRVVVDYFNSNQMGFFTKELEDAGFRMKSKMKGAKIRKWTSRDGSTRAWTRYDARKRISTLVLEPTR